MERRPAQPVKRNLWKARASQPSPRRGRRNSERVPRQAVARAVPGVTRTNLNPPCAHSRPSPLPRTLRTPHPVPKPRQVIPTIGAPRLEVVLPPHPLAPPHAQASCAEQSDRNRPRDNPQASRFQSERRRVRHVSRQEALPYVPACGVPARWKCPARREAPEPLSIRLRERVRAHPKRRPRRVAHLPKPIHKHSPRKPRPIPSLPHFQATPPRRHPNPRHQHPEHNQHPPHHPPPAANPATQFPITPTHVSVYRPKPRSLRTGADPRLRSPQGCKSVAGGKRAAAASAAPGTHPVRSRACKARTPHRPRPDPVPQNKAITKLRNGAHLTRA